jgi:hypothetical protein
MVIYILVHGIYIPKDGDAGRCLGLANIEGRSTHAMRSLSLSFFDFFLLASQLYKCSFI